MTDIRIINGTIESLLQLDGKTVARLPHCDYAEDSFKQLTDCAFRWIRTADAPRYHARMELITEELPTFTMIPAVSYNGNGWGTTPEYIGDRAEDGQVWTFAWHRPTIPSCTFSATPSASLALMAEANDDTACSLYREGDHEHHAVIYPEEERPKTLSRHFWMPAYQGTGTPRTVFTAIIVVYPAADTSTRYDRMLDFAWRYYGHPIAMPKPPEELMRLGIAFNRYLWQERKDGFRGFAEIAIWDPALTAYMKKRDYYEIGWVGQSASLSCAMIQHYLDTGDKSALDMGVAALDCWLEHGWHANGLIDARFDFRPWRKQEDPESYDRNNLWQYGECMFITDPVTGKRKFRRTHDGLIKLRLDACNLGCAADGFFEAYDLLQKCGIDRPKYRKAAFGLLDFIMKSQEESGRLAMSWDEDGTVLQRDGTVGCFLILPLITAYKVSGHDVYLEAAKRAFDFYYGSLKRDGFTTAGALDTYSIDKESSSPLLRDALALFDITKDNAYITAAEHIAWYLSSWIMHCTITYPKDCLITQLGYDTFGSTAVSTPHNAIDQYALRDVLSFLKLSELTGKVQWKEKALACFANASQGISDGTLYINGRLRPAGSQDEAIMHTRWQRPWGKPFSLSQLLPAWPNAYRLEILRWYPDWDVFRNGLERIEGAIQKDSL